MWWIPSAIQGGVSLANYLANKNSQKNMPERPSFENSKYAQQLQGLSQTGAYSPVAQQNIMNDVSRKTAQSTAEGKSGYLGRLTANGMGNSIAAQAGMNKFDQNRTGALADASRKLQTENEMSKVDFANQYGQMAWQDQMAGYQDAMNRNAMSQQNTNQLFGGLGQAAGSLGQGYSSMLADKRFQTDLEKLSGMQFNGMGDWQIMAILNKLGTGKLQ